jgi:disulfide bond formation protein DsbB
MWNHGAHTILGLLATIFLIGAFLSLAAAPAATARVQGPTDGLATASTQLSFEPARILPLEQGAGHVAVGDFNGDQIVDICANFNIGEYPYNPSRFAVFLGTGGGTSPRL